MRWGAMEESFISDRYLFFVSFSLQEKCDSGFHFFFLKEVM